MDESSFLVEIVLKAVDQASGPIRSLNRAVDDLKARGAASQATGDLSRGLDDVGRSARDAEGDVRSHREEVDRGHESARQHAQQVGRSADAIDSHASSAAAARAPVRALGDDTDKATKAAKDHAEAVSRVAEEYRNWSTVSRTSALSNAENARGLQQISRDADQLTRVLPRASQAWRDMSNIAQEARRSARQSGVADEANRLTRSYREFDQMARAGRVTASAAKDSYRDFATSFDRLRDSIDKGSGSWRQFGRLIDEATKKAANAKAVVTGGGLISGFLGNLGNAARGGGLQDVDRAFQNVAAHADNFGLKIVSLSAQLRGLALTAGLGLFQQLDTAVVGAAGALFSLGSAAGQAAATVGGTLVAAMGQAIPVVALAADAFNRFQIILQAVQAAQNLQQQSAVNSVAQQVNTLSGTNSVITAQQQLTNSYQHVRQAQESVLVSQENLTIARRDAQRQITDLMLAERAAELQAKGANISLEQAQQNLQRTILTGGTGPALESAQLQVQQAQLGVRQAGVQLPRARADAARAQRQGVSGAPPVISAERSLTQSRQGLVQATQAVGNASRALEIARIQASQATSSIATASHTLSFLLGQLSPAERQVYNILERFQSYFRNPSSPFNRIADYLVAPFAKGLGRLFVLLNDRKFLAPLDRLGQAMGAGLNRIFGTLFGRQGAGFFEQMAGDAAKNIPIITDSIVKIIRIFEDIAKTASPILHIFIQDFNRFITGLSARWSSPQGLKELTTFFVRGAKYAEEFVRWGGAVVRLIMALAGQAAPVGGGLIQGWTNSLNHMTTWVQSHGAEVHRFFVQSGDALNTLLGMIGAMGRGMVQLMDSGGLRALGQFFSQVIIPVLVDAGKVLGTFTNLLLGLLNSVPGLRTFVDLFGGFAVAAIAIGKLYAPLHRFIGLLLALKEGGAAFVAMRSAGGGLLDSLNAARDATALRLKAEQSIVVAIREQTAALEQQAVVQRETGAGGVVGGRGAAGGGTKQGGSSLLRDAEAGAGGAGGVGAIEAAGGLSTVAGAALLPLLGMLAPSILGVGTIPQLSSHTAKGLGSLIGPVGPTAVVQERAGGRGGSYGTVIENANTSNVRLRGLQEGLRGITSPLQLSTGQLNKLYREATRLQQLPDITQRQRDGLVKLRSALNPTNVAMQRAAVIWGDTFKGIGVTTGNVMAQVKTQLATDIQNISSNLGLGTKPGARALVASVNSAYQTILDNTTLTARETRNGIKTIGDMLQRAFAALGVKDPGKLAHGMAKGDIGATITGTGVLKTQSAGVNIGGLARGGWNPARPGGTPYIAGEAGHDEVTLTTDPRHSDRQRTLLGQFFHRAPHMAPGGLVERTHPEVQAGVAAAADDVLSRFPGLRITSTYRPGGSSYHARHEAIDLASGNYGYMNKAAAWIGSHISNQLTEGIHNPDLSVKFGRNVPASYWGASTWQQHLNHIHIAVADAFKQSAAGAAGGAGVGRLAAAVQRIKSPAIKVSGAIGEIGQAGLDRVTRAANNYLAGITGSLISSGGVPTGPVPGSLVQWLTQALKLTHHFSGSNLSALEGRAMQESGGNAHAINLWDSNAKAGHPSKGLLQTIDSTFQSYMLPGHGNIWNPIDNAIAAIRYMFAKYGHIVGAGSGGYDVGGRIGNAPWGGRPVPIVAHEGERINNPNQWEHIAGLGGMTGSQLDQHMGYDRRSPRQSFDVGGAPVPLSSRNEPQSSHGVGGFSLADINWGSVGSISVIVRALNTSFAKLNRIGVKSADFARNFIPFVNQLLAQDVGVFDRLNAGFTVIQNALNAALVVGGRVAGRGMTQAQRGYLGNIHSPYRVTPTGVTQVMSPANQDAQQIRSLNEQRTYLQGEENLVGTALNQVRRRLTAVRRLARRDPSKYRAVLQALTSQYNNLLGRMQTLTGTIAQNVSDTFSAEQTRIQDWLTRISDRFDTAQQAIQNKQQTAQTFGNYSQLPALDRALISSAQRQIKELQPVLKAAEKTGNQDLIAQIKQQIGQLQSTVSQMTAQIIQDQISGIQQAAQTQQAQVSEYQTIAQSVLSSASTPGQFAWGGALNARALSLNQSSLQSQLSSYNSLLGQAVSTGNTGAVASITQTIDQLTAELVQNSQALQDNTAQIVQQTSQFVQARGQFLTGVYGGIGQIIQTVGQITGFTDVGALRGVTQQSNRTLQDTNSGLVGQLGQLGGGASWIAGALTGVTDPSKFASLLSRINLGGVESGQDATWITTFEGIISSLESNTQAIATNNQQLAQLNGQLLQPQSWASMTWTTFRAAVFSGMGNLMPAYQGLLAGTSAAPAIAPIFSPVAGAAGTMPTIGHLSLTHPVEKLDPQVLGEQLFHHLSTTPPS